MDMPRRLGAEFFGTFWLTFAGCGSAVLAAGFPTLGIGFLGVSFAFGLTVLTMAYAVGHISGGHFNCAVTIGLWAGGRFKATDVVPYVIAPVVGVIVAAGVLYTIASGKPDWVPGGFASNGYGDLSPGKYGLVSCFVIEVIATFFFLYVIIGTTSKGAAVGFAGIPIGLTSILPIGLVCLRAPAREREADISRSLAIGRTRHRIQHSPVALEACGGRCFTDA